MCKYCAVFGLWRRQENERGGIVQGLFSAKQGFPSSRSYLLCGLGMLFDVVYLWVICHLLYKLVRVSIKHTSVNFQGTKRVILSNLQKSLIVDYDYQGRLFSEIWWILLIYREESGRGFLDRKICS